MHHVLYEWSELVELDKHVEHLENAIKSINSLVQRFAKEFSENEILNDEIFSEEEKNNEQDNQLVKNNKIEKSKYTK